MRRRELQDVRCGGTTPAALLQYFRDFGYDRPATREELKTRFDMPDRAIRKAIERLRVQFKNEEAGETIIKADGAGYVLTKDRAKIELYAAITKQQGISTIITSYNVLGSINKKEAARQEQLTLELSI